jgi:hypothetical protein
MFSILNTLLTPAFVYIHINLCEFCKRISHWAFILQIRLDILIIRHRKTIVVFLVSFLSIGY